MTTFYFYLRGTIVIFFTKKRSVLESLHYDRLYFASWINHSDPVGVLVRIWFKQENVLEKIVENKNL